MHINGDTATVISHCHGAVTIECYGHQIAMSGQRLINRIIDDFIDHVMQARAVIGITDIHAGSFAHRFEPTQNLDRSGVISFRVYGQGCIFFTSHDLQLSGWG